MNRRTGVTLTEVLIAIFIMGIGLLAILSLFPLGASQMAQALRDQRAAECAANGGALARVIWKQVCEEIYPTGTTVTAFREQTSNRKYPRSNQRFISALDDPNFNDDSNNNPLSYPGIASGGLGFPTGTAVPNGSGAPRAFLDMTPLPISGPGEDQSSYPVIVDPMGWYANRASGNANNQWWLPTQTYTIFQKNQPNAATVGEGPRSVTGAIPRRPLFQKAGTSTSSPWTEVTNRSEILRQFSLTDDMTFDKNGLPVTADGTTGGAIERLGRYSWSLMFRRNRNDMNNRRKIDATVIVYSGRSLDVASPETAYVATGANDSRLITIAMKDGANGTQKRPAVRRGSWVLDATIFGGTGQIAPQGRFYRVVNVEEGVNGGQPEFYLELQTPLAYVTPPPKANAAVVVPPPPSRIIVVMEKVIEVFQKGEIGADLAPTTY
ncbi:MAG: prepilin-type N-terminal cleavage/methylation domain-containing protein [Gemmataceae bacterium]